MTEKKSKFQQPDSQDLNISFEFFPPKTEKMEKTLWSSIVRLAPLQPKFVSVTYGAGGSTRERTHSTVSRIVKETNLKPAAHLTCVSATKEEINEVIRSYWEAGVRHIVALRGDSPDGIGAKYVTHPGGYEGTPDLIRGIKDIGDFEVSVAAYPEVHPESTTLNTDLDILQAKVDAGADRAITQFFFDNDDYFRYLDAVRARGINIPVTAGINPIVNFKTAKSFAEKCGAKMPALLERRFEGLENEDEIRKMVAVAVVAEQVDELVQKGVRDFHFYTLNRADLTYAICHWLGMRPVAEE